MAINFLWQRWRGILKTYLVIIMYIKKIDEQNKVLHIAIPLTQTSGKTRIKQRSFIYEYGLPFPPRSNKIMQNCYIEWQIGYDAVFDDKKRKLTTGVGINFIGANGKTKVMYELSEYIYYFYKWNIIARQGLIDIIDYLNNTSQSNLIERNQELAITRTHPVHRNICDIQFEASHVSYPLLIHKFQNYEIIAEIIIKEKQRAVDTQPMLYFCFPITELRATNGEYFVGRIAEKKRRRDFYHKPRQYKGIYANDKNIWNFKHKP
jgi:hypothetical protein